MFEFSRSTNLVRTFAIALFSELTGYTRDSAGLVLESMPNPIQVKDHKLHKRLLMEERNLLEAFSLEDWMNIKIHHCIFRLKDTKILLELYARHTDEGLLLHFVFGHVRVLKEPYNKLRWEDLENGDVELISGKHICFAKFRMEGTNSMDRHITAELYPLDEYIDNLEGLRESLKILANVA